MDTTEESSGENHRGVQWETTEESSEATVGPVQWCSGATVGFSGAGSATVGIQWCRVSHSGKHSGDAVVVQDPDPYHGVVPYHARPPGTPLPRVPHHATTPCTRVLYPDTHAVCTVSQRGLSVFAKLTPTGCLEKPSSVSSRALPDMPGLTVSVSVVSVSPEPERPFCQKKCHFSQKGGFLAKRSHFSQKGWFFSQKWSHFSRKWCFLAREKGF